MVATAAVHITWFWAFLQARYIDDGRAPFIGGYVAAAAVDTVFVIDMTTAVRLFRATRVCGLKYRRKG